MEQVKKVLYSIVILILFILTALTGITYYSIVTSSDESFKNQEIRLALEQRQFYTSLESKQNSTQIAFPVYGEYQSAETKENLELYKKLRESNDQSSLHKEYPDTTPWCIELASRVYQVFRSYCD